MAFIITKCQRLLATLERVAFGESAKRGTTVVIGGPFTTGGVHYPL